MNQERFEEVFEILMLAMRELGERGLSIDERLPALLDYTAAVALIVGGEEGLRTATHRMDARRIDWRRGEFPTAGSFARIHLDSNRKRKKVVTINEPGEPITGSEVAFNLITGAIDTLRFEVGIPPAEILAVLTDATAVIGFQLGQRAGVEAAVQMVRDRINLFEETCNSQDTDKAGWVN